jgi:hypothetical protein
VTAPGPLGEEALRLVEAAREWAVRTFPEVDAHVATGSPECCWCPLCRAVAVLRGDPPGVTERLAEVVTAAAGALAAVLDAAGRPAPTPPAAPASAAAPSRPAEPTRDPGPATPAHRVELIPVDED